jgi:26S proteasome regulatory subunit N7
MTQSDLEQKIKQIDEKIAKAEDTVEEIDIAQFNLEKAKLYKEYKKKDEAIEEFKTVIAKTQSFNNKMDSVFEILHIAILYKDIPLLKEHIDLCRKFLKDAGDWEKRNKLKVYDGLYNVLTKDFKVAGKLFLEALMTFTNTELFDYKDFVFYTAITNIITVDRVTLKNRVIDNSDVVSCIREIPHLQGFLDSFYLGKYKEFFNEFHAIIQRTKNDFFLSRHNNYFINEMRIKVYSQFLRKLILTVRVL